MSGMKWVIAGVLLAGAPGHATGTRNHPISNPSDTVLLDNGTARMSINRFGGAISSFSLTEQGLNPFSWKPWNWETDTAKKEGFFVCFDRIGFPAAAEQEKGIPFHGEATSVHWKPLHQSTNEFGDLILKVQCDLPIAKLQLIREYTLYNNSSVCRITDCIRNKNSTAKDWNILHHPSLSAPFLDASVLVDCNASTGFLNEKDLKRLPGTIRSWPRVMHRNKTVDLRKFDDFDRMVWNFACAPTVRQGWGCVSNPGRELLVGCLWETDQYPWMRIWREAEENTPTALGIEFGTSPFGGPLEQIRAKGEVLNLPTMETLQPEEEIRKTFYLFLAKIPVDYTGVSHVGIDGKQLCITERNPSEERRIQLPAQTIP
jgi:hypothetical protein